MTTYRIHKASASLIENKEVPAGYEEFFIVAVPKSAYDDILSEAMSLACYVEEFIKTKHYRHMDRLETAVKGFRERCADNVQPSSDTVTLDVGVTEYAHGAVGASNNNPSKLRGKLTYTPQHQGRSE